MRHSTRERSATLVRAERESIAGVGGSALGLHEELAHPATREELRCTCGPAYLKLRSEHGELVRPRGGSVNRCEYCARLAAVENCEMLSLDAGEGDPPTGLIVLGTRTPFPTLPGACECDELDGQRCERCSLVRNMMAPYRQALRLVKRALKRRWPRFEYASLLEYTTGYAERSGGLRRLHLNLLTKGIPDDELDDAGAIAFRIWCTHIDAEIQAQDVRPIYAAGGLMRYLALHFQKESQQPPEGFSGQRFNASTGYFTGCTRAQARARARDALALKRELHRHALVLDDAHDIELAAQLSHRRNLATRWTLASETGGRLGDAVLAPTSLVERLHDRLRPPIVSNCDP